MASSDKALKSFIEKRIASLTGGIGVIYVGGNTDLEQKELYDRVDDAVCAVKSALEEGILPGGGLSLFSIGKGYEELSKVENISAKKIAYAILGHALKAPLTQILDNAGMNVSMYEVKKLKWGEGFDVKNEKAIPAMYKGYEVINGDLTDYRIDDGNGIIVGLKWKHIANKEAEQYVLNSCFVVKPSFKTAVENGMSKTVSLMSK